MSYCRKIMNDLNNCDDDHISEYDKKEALRELYIFLGDGKMFIDEFELTEFLKVFGYEKVEKDA